MHGLVNLSTAFTLGVKWFETPQASRHHGNRRFPDDPEALGLPRLQDGTEVDFPQVFIIESEHGQVTRWQSYLPFPPPADE